MRRYILERKVIVQKNSGTSTDIYFSSPVLTIRQIDRGRISSYAIDYSYLNISE